MEGKFVSVRIRPVKGSRAKFQYRHDTRQRIPSYADPRADQRVVYIVRPDGDPAMWRVEQEQLAKNVGGRKLRKDAPWGLSGIITFSQDVQVSQSQIPAFDAKAKEAVQKIADFLGGVKVRYLVRHIDESRAHYHFWLDYTQESTGKTITKKINPAKGGRETCRKIQDLAGETFSALGLRRGQYKEDKLQFLRKLQQVGIDNSLFSRIREQVLYSKRTLRDLHDTLQRDTKIKQQIQQKIEAVQAKVLAGEPVSKEEIAICAAEIAKTDVKKALEFLRLWREQGQNREADVERQAEQIVQECRKGWLKKVDGEKVKEIITNLLTVNRDLRNALQKREKEIQAKTEENRRIKKALWMLQKKYRKLKKYLQNPAWLQAWLEKITRPAAPEAGKVFGYSNQKSGNRTGEGGTRTRTVPPGRCGR